MRLPFCRLISIAHFKPDVFISQGKSVFQKIFSPFENQQDKILIEAEEDKMKVCSAHVRILSQN